MNDVMSGFVGAIVGALVTIVVQAFVLKFNYKQLFAETVTQNRTRTINELREAISQILAFIRYIEFDKKEIISIDNIDDKIKENVKKYNQEKLNFYKNIYKVKMLLSIHPEKIGNLFHKELEDELDILLDKENIEKICQDNKISENIENYARNIFDYEWKRVKEEAKGEEDEL